MVACGPGATVVEARGPKNSVPQWGMPVLGELMISRLASASAPLMVYIIRTSLQISVVTTLLAFIITLVRGDGLLLSASAPQMLNRAKIVSGKNTLLNRGVMFRHTAGVIRMVLVGVSGFTPVYADAYPGKPTRYAESLDIPLTLAKIGLAIHRVKPA